MEISDFIRDIAKKIEEVSGVLDVSQESTLPKEVWLSDQELVGGKGTGQIILRTAEQTQNKDVVQLKQFDPYYFLNKDLEIPCRVPGCLETRKFVQKYESHEKSEKVKRDLFLCEAHREKLMSRVSKRCAKGNITVDVASFKKDDFTGYTSLIGVLEKAFIPLKSKWWRGANDILLAEIFLNTRNFLIITNALLNHCEDNTETVLGPYLTTFVKVLEDPTKLKNGLTLLPLVLGMILNAYAITYEWIHIPIENPGAKIGAGMGILSALFVIKMFKFSLE